MRTQTRTRLLCSALFGSALLCREVNAQGQWLSGYDHQISGTSVDPAGVIASVPASLPQYWVTENSVELNPLSPNLGRPTNVPGQRFQAVHTCLIPSGPFRGCLLVWDGNLTLVGTRTYQPWAIVNPYGVASPTTPFFNPFVAGGGSGYRFHNQLLLMEPGNPLSQQTNNGPGELFCAGQRWASDGRLFLAGGTRRYPLIGVFPGTTVPVPLVNSGYAGGWEGTSFVYQWDFAPTVGNPFGSWFRMFNQNLDAERWYPTVVSDGSLQDRFLVLGGTDLMPTGPNPTITDFVNTYESYRINPLATPPTCTFERKPNLIRQYAPPPASPTYGSAWFSDYPRAHGLGVIHDSSGPLPGVNRMFVSGYLGQGFSWAHDPNSDPLYSLNIGIEPSPTYTEYSTNILLPAAVGAIPRTVVRIGGARGPLPGTTSPTDRVESVLATGALTATSFWSVPGPASMPQMAFRRHFPNVVMLPTGDLFAVGGESGTGTYSNIPELLSNNAWTPQQPHTSPRAYHSCALLLPDASVFVCSGENRTTDYQVWLPQYLIGTAGRAPKDVAVFDGTTGAAVSTTQLGAATYGQLCFATWSNALPPNVEVAQVVLMAPAALTHHDDGGQRCIRLPLVGDDFVFSGTHFLMPATFRHAPKGWYMLFLITNEGVPARATFVNLG